MIFFPFGETGKKSYETESLSREQFRFTNRKKKHRDAIARLFPVGEPENTSASPFPAASLVHNGTVWA